MHALYFKAYQSPKYLSLQNTSQRVRWPPVLAVLAPSRARWMSTRGIYPALESTGPKIRLGGTRVYTIGRRCQERQQKRQSLSVQGFDVSIPAPDTRHDTEHPPITSCYFRAILDVGFRRTKARFQRYHNDYQLGFRRSFRDASCPWEHMESRNCPI
jgi:hypothetical protein